MRQRSSSCDPEGLRQLLDGGELESLQTDRIRHLDECETCRYKLEMMAGGERWWEDARRFVGMEADAPSKRGDGHDNETIPVNAATETPIDHGENLSFLSPSSSPGSLGVLGPYEILGVLGRGGMGLVLRGHDPALNRPVAIKLLAPAAAAGILARKRFAREARAAAAVVHEHVVAIHAVDEAGGLPYLVMQYIAGRSLQERIDRAGPLRVEEVLRIGMQTASGLAAAHAQGLVHRDVKPANILLENGVERVKLTDFGLARATDDSGLTQSGVVAGTPQYMAPEQARGEAVDHRCDLFGLGSVLYAMCAGRAPFRADSTLAVMRRICDEQPRPIRQINPEVPDWLEALIARLHEKEPAARYQSAAEVAGILALHLAQLQDSGWKPSRPESGDFAKAIRGRARSSKAMVLILLGACTVAGIVGAARTLIHPARANRAVAPTPHERSDHNTPEPSVLTAEPISPTGPYRTLTGIVRDRDTGEPIPGVHLTLTGQPVATTTDTEGRFELRGQAHSQILGRGLGERMDLAVEPISLPYLAVNVEATGDGVDVIHAEIRLPRGIPFRLRLADAATGGPVRSARVVYRPLHPNPFVERAMPRGVSGFYCRATEEPEGTYTGVVLPGPGAIAVESYADHYGAVSVDPVAFFVPGSSASESVNASTAYGTRQLLAVEIGGSHGVYFWPQDKMSGIVLINPGPDDGPLDRDLTLRDNHAKVVAP